MTQQAAVIADVNEQVNVNNNGQHNGPEMDEYGRDAAERTVELESRDAEAINLEVEQGKWDSYDDALHYVITRGLAEIKRQRDAARVALEKTQIKVKRDSYATLMKSNPSLIANAEFVATMLRDMQITK